MVERLLFSEEDPRPYAVLRIVVGCMAFLSIVSFTPHLDFFFSDQGFYPLETMGQFQRRHYPISLFYLSGKPVWVYTVFFFSLAVSVAFAVGWKTRFMGPLLWICLASYVHRNIFVMDGSFVLLLQIMIVFMWVDSSAVWSLDARHRKGEPPRIDSWVGFCLRFQLCVIYFASGFYKMMGADWVKGDAIPYVLANPLWRRYDFDALLQIDFVLVPLHFITMIVIYWELFFPLLVLHRYTRWAALLFGLFLHGSQWLTINTAFFSPILVTLYLFFLKKPTQEKLFHKLSSVLKRES